MSEGHVSDSWIAIVGMACHFPGADNPTEYWENIKLGVESRVDARGDHPVLPRQIHDGRIWVNSTFCCSKPDHFDAKFFGYSPAEASLIDPQQRLLLHTAWEAIEDAGYDLTRYSGTVGVFAGVGPNWYALRNLATRQDVIDRVGLAGLFASDKDFASTRIAHFLDLRGPAIGIQTACSTSLVAVHVASQSLLAGECDMALVGAASIRVPFDQGYEAIEGGILSPSGRCRVFDASADGTVPGSGAGMVVLKRFEDAVLERDNILAVLRGTAVNNNGSAPVGFSAPSARGQAEAISLAQRLSGIDPSTIGLVEAHGTGTKIGDPIEIEGLRLAFGPKEANTCAIGSAKANIGHLDTAAGIAGLMKAALALKHHMMPPTINFSKLNENIIFEGTPFYVNKLLQSWRSGEKARRACVSSFGIGGTNAHAVLEEAPPEQRLVSCSDKPELLVISARSLVALEESARRLGSFLTKVEQPHAVADIAFTLAVGRRAWPYRGFMLAGPNVGTKGISAPFLSRQATSKERPVVFVVSGHLPSSSGFVESLLSDFPVLSETLAGCWEAFASCGGSEIKATKLSEVTGRATMRPTISLPLAFSVNYAIAEFWKAWGVKPQAILGHGIGDYVAGCLSGAYSLGEIISLVTTYAEYLDGMKRGFMLSVSEAADVLEPLLPQGLYIASVNSVNDCVVSGPQDAFECFTSILENARIGYKVSPSQLPFHSPLMASAITDHSIFRDDGIQRIPKISWSSSSRRNLMEKGKTIPPRFWVDHTCGKLDLCKALSDIPNRLESVYFEIGIGNQLTPLLQKSLRGSSVSIVGPLSEHSEIPSRQQVLNALGRVWSFGACVNLETLYSKDGCRRVPLPTYPFESQRFWIEPGDQSSISGSEVQSKAAMDDNARREKFNSDGSSAIEKIITSVWSSHLGISEVAPDDDFFEIGGDSLIATSVFSDIRTRLRTTLDSDLIYRYPTARLLSDFLLSQQDGPRLMRIAEIYFQVEALSDSEVEAGLATKVARSEVEG